MSNNLLFSVEKQIGVITLNRPSALNALDYEMIQQLYTQLKIWAESPDIKAVIIQAAEGRAFCAGGDVRGLYELGLKDREAPLQFFRNEYQLNYLIAHYPKPYIPLLNGITFGGGVGISLHSPYAIASEHFVFAMPETSIGFFPDIGASYFLSRSIGAYGTFLGLTGERVDAQKALFLKLIRAMIPSHLFSDFTSALFDLDLSYHAHEKIEQCIQAYQQPLQIMLSELDTVNHHFKADTIDKLFMSLQDEKSSWADMILQLLQQKSPLSLAVTLEQLKRAKTKSLADCLKMDYELTYHFMQHTDFFEGVRALLIDKDKSPRWSDEYSAYQVETYFSGIPHHIQHLTLGSVFA